MYIFLSQVCVNASYTVFIDELAISIDHLRVYRYFSSRDSCHMVQEIFHRLGRIRIDSSYCYLRRDNRCHNGPRFDRKCKHPCFEFPAILLIVSMYRGGCSSCHINLCRRIHDKPFTDVGCYRRQSRYQLRLSTQRVQVRPRHLLPWIEYVTTDTWWLQL